MAQSYIAGPPASAFFMVCLYSLRRTFCYIFVPHFNFGICSHLIVILSSLFDVVVVFVFLPAFLGLQLFITLQVFFITLLDIRVAYYYPLTHPSFTLHFTPSTALFVIRFQGSTFHPSYGTFSPSFNSCLLHVQSRLSYFHRE